MTRHRSFVARLALAAIVSATGAGILKHVRTHSEMTCWEWGFCLTMHYEATDWEYWYYGCYRDHPYDCGA